MSTILPGIGERLMCTSSGDKKILITVPPDCRSIRVTRPSAGDTTTSGSDGGTRFGCRKKKAIKSATMIKTPDTYQYPNAAAPTPNTAGTRMYGMLSLTMRNFQSPRLPVPASPRLCLWPFHVKGDAQLLFHVPFNTLKLGETARGSFSDSSSDFSGTAASLSTSDL